MPLLGLDNSIENLIINRDKNHCYCTKALTNEMIIAIQNYECLSLAFSSGEWPDLSFMNTLSPSLISLRVQSDKIDWRLLIHSLS